MRRPEHSRPPLVRTLIGMLGVLGALVLVHPAAGDSAVPAAGTADPAAPAASVPPAASAPTADKASVPSPSAAPTATPSSAPGSGADAGGSSVAPAGGDAAGTTTGSPLPSIVPPVPFGTPAPIAHIPDADFIAFLSANIRWFRDIRAAASLVTDADDVVFFDAARDDALRVLNLGFEAAHAQASMSHGDGVVDAEAAKAAEKASQREAEARDRIAKLEPRLAAVTAQLQTVDEAGRPALTLEKARLEGQVNFFRTYAVIIGSYQSVLRDSALGRNGSLADKITELEQSVPEAREAPPKVVPKAGAPGPGFPGLDRLVVDVVDLQRKASAINALARSTERFKDSVERLRGPIRDIVRGITARAKEINDRENARSPLATRLDPAELDQLTLRFQQLVPVNFPLSRQERTLDAMHGNLLEWGVSVHRHVMEGVHRVLLHLAGVALAIGAVLLVARLWRGAVFRYVQETRRRRQLLLVRRIVVWALSIFILLSAFLSDFGSWATVAGFATAGVAVALQSLILSVVAYFFLIGRYGLRAGDRVTIAGVTGDVIEVGLVRIYLAELTGEPGDLHPTGRVVLFPNAVIFQASANFYKQMPGTEYTWHELALTLSPQSDLDLAEQRLTSAAESVLHDYEEVLAAQHAKARVATNFEVEPPRAYSRLRFGHGGLEFVLRYPVEIRHAVDIDDRLTRALVAAIEGTPGLRLVDGGNARIQHEAV